MKSTGKHPNIGKMATVTCVLGHIYTAELKPVVERANAPAGQYSRNKAYTTARPDACPTCHFMAVTWKLQ